MTHIMGYFFLKQKKKSFDIVGLWEKKKFKKIPVYKRGEIWFENAC
jgi:hypothetical protein